MTQSFLSAWPVSIMPHSWQLSLNNFHNTASRSLRAINTQSSNLWASPYSRHRWETRVDPREHIFAGQRSGTTQAHKTTQCAHFADGTRPDQLSHTGEGKTEWSRSKKSEDWRCFNSWRRCFHIKEKCALFPWSLIFDFSVFGCSVTKLP